MDGCSLAEGEYLRHMHLDPLTLMVPEVIASAISSLIVLGAWLRFRDATALIWWGLAHAANAIGLAMIVAAFATSDPARLPLAGAIMGRLFDHDMGPMPPMAKKGLRHRR